MDAREIRFTASKSQGEVSALLLDPPASNCLLVLGHGAGAGMEHPFLEALAQDLAQVDVATLRYQFPYMEAGRKRPDFGPILQATVRSAIAVAGQEANGRALFAGGKSMGGRMTSLAAAKEALEDVKGLVFVGFPLHPAGKPGTERGEHLPSVGLPMLFLQGTRDRLADLDLLRPVLEPLEGRGDLHVVEGADHSFAMLKRSGRSQADVIAELARTTADWIGDILSGGN